MDRVGGIGAFQRQPLGRCLVGRTWVHFCAHRELFGVTLFDRPNGDDMRRLVRSLAVELGDEIAPHRSLIDARRVTSIEVTAFDNLATYVKDNYARLAGRVQKLAVIRPDGAAGALVAGFFAVVAAPYPVEVFPGLSDALTWLGESSPTLTSELDDLVGSSTGVPPVLLAVRDLLADRIDITFGEICRALNVSERTLQRRLREERTSFRKELSDARLREAERRMLDSDLPLTTVALDVGFTSLQHFSALFRKRTGQAPSVWRTRHRR